MTAPSVAFSASPFVSTAWLAERLGAADIVVLDASYYLPTQKRDADAEYRAGHIPGALRFDIEAVADKSTTLPHMMPSAAAFAAAVGAMGISERDTVVVYDGLGLFSAPRVWWTFRVFGARAVFVLEGGLPRWVAEGRPLETGTATRPPTTFAVSTPPDVIADVARVQRTLAEGSAQVVDARAADRFRGEAPEPRPGLPSGHIPGSLNVPHATLVRDGTLKPADELAAAFAAGGVDLDRPVLTSCGSGVSAAVLWIALHTLGREPVALYDGSWTEWAGRGDLPIATGAG
ncbi:3-mercaptopyruvate sulfurtransferase [Rhodoplanes serenus]|uniref:3-mercaptopyruvate sulfurtransferase n=1 Tax=Rhodoplanes serenus TaxID=200615 RepID=UPI000DAED48A|nr:3-mercaptopyruvate sulfurtransferase [Rhodoplanes serenus]RAI34044.1 3-mercaptopyruvate sulfurtransferase [Rhodoplanes serenus]